MALDPRIELAAKRIRLGEFPSFLWLVTMYCGLCQSREDVLKTKASLPFDVEVHAHLDGQASALWAIMEAIGAGIDAAADEREGR